MRTLFGMTVLTLISGLVGAPPAHGQTNPRAGYPCVKYSVFETAEGGYFAGPACEYETDAKQVGPRECDLEACQRWIKENWTDMRPLSLRRQMTRARMSTKDTRLTVIINHEEQYSVALASGPIPRGWRKVGEPCLLDACMDYIEEVWTDMRPLSVRRRMPRRPGGR